MSVLLNAVDVIAGSSSMVLDGLLEIELLYPDRDGFDHPVRPDQFRFVHNCRMIDEHTRVRCAPRLDPAHRVEWRIDGLWISPSILCPDCGTHGFVSASRWEPV